MRWQHIEFSDGSNPYICKTEKEFNRMKQKYGNTMTHIKGIFWKVQMPKRKETF